MRLSFTQSNCIIVNSSVDSHSEELKYRFGELVQLGFFGSAFVYTHVMFMALESDLPTVQLKSEFKQKVLYMTEKYISSTWVEWHLNLSVLSLSSHTR